MRNGALRLPHVARSPAHFMGDETPYGDGGDMFSSLFVNLVTRLERFSFGEGPQERSLELEVSTAACTDHDLTGQILWPGARLLCHWLGKQPDSFFSAPALELGAGTGLAGLYYCARGGSVVLTDYQPVVLDLLTRNGAAVRCDQPSAGPLRVAPLLWGDGAAHSGLLSDTPDGQGYPVLLAADVVYPGSQNALPGLVSSVCALLAPGGALYLCYCSRARTTDVALFDALRDAGLTAQQVSEPVLDGSVSGIVYCIQRAP